MKNAALLLLVLSIVLGTYGYWGAFTHSGQKYYDEMDAMLPFFTLLFACLLAMISVILAIILFFRKK
jgi:hypothetical protein